MDYRFLFSRSENFSTFFNYRKKFFPWINRKLFEVLVMNFSFLGLVFVFARRDYPLHSGLSLCLCFFSRPSDEKDLTTKLCFRRISLPGPATEDS